MTKKDRHGAAVVSEMSPVEVGKCSLESFIAGSVASEATYHLHLTRMVLRIMFQ